VNLTLLLSEFAFYVNKTGWRSRKEFMVYWEGSPTGFGESERWRIASTHTLDQRCIILMSSLSNQRSLRYGTLRRVPCHKLSKGTIFACYSPIHHLLRPMELINPISILTRSNSSDTTPTHHHLPRIHMADGRRWARRTMDTEPLSHQSRNPTPTIALMHFSGTRS
jgi:hypothetical protein